MLNRRNDSISSSDAQRWIEAARGLPLSKSESQVLKRCEKDTTGKSFLALAEIFATHRRNDDSLEILANGVARFPDFATARVILARELFRKGMVDEAWEALQYNPASLSGNGLAQKLLFRLAILRMDGAEALGLGDGLRRRGMLDEELRQLLEMLTRMPLETVYEELVLQLRQQGIEPRRIAANRSAVEDGMSSVAERSGATNGHGARGDLGPEAPLTVPRTWDADSLNGFYVVGLSDIFQPGDDGNARIAGSLADPLELDSATLAEIYAEQGHYGKAFEVYKRLLRQAPGNELYKRQAGEMLRKRMEQRQQDEEMDPTIFDRMANLEIIDTQIRFYSGLLSQLD